MNVNLEALINGTSQADNSAFQALLAINDVHHKLLDVYFDTEAFFEAGSVRARLPKPRADRPSYGFPDNPAWFLQNVTTLALSTLNLAGAVSRELSGSGDKTAEKLAKAFDTIERDLKAACRPLDPLMGRWIEEEPARYEARLKEECRKAAQGIQYVIGCSLPKEILHSFAP